MYDTKSCHAARWTLPSKRGCVIAAGKYTLNTHYTVSSYQGFFFLSIQIVQVWAFSDMNLNSVLTSIFTLN